MKTIKELLKKTQPLADSTTVTLTLHVPLKKVRAQKKRLASLGVVKDTIPGGAKAAAKKAKPKGNATPAVKKTTTRNKPARQSQPTAAVKQPVNAKSATKKAPAQRGNTTGVTQAAVLAALRAKHVTPHAIATAMKANRVQVNKALSRYTQQGLIVRTAPGQYALKT